MFHFSDKQISSIISSDDTEFSNYIAAVASKAKAQYKPLFFTPYRKGREFIAELVAPALDSLTLVGIAGAATAAAIIATAASLGSLLVAGVAALFRNTSVRDDAFDLSCNMMIQIGVGLLTAATSLFLAIANLPYGLTSLVTRSATTLCSPATVQQSVSNEGLELEPAYYSPAL